VKPGTQKQPTPEACLLTVAETAKLLGTTEKAIRERVARRVLPFRRICARVMFVRNELESFIEQSSGCSLQEALVNISKRQQ